MEEDPAGNFRDRHEVLTPMFAAVLQLFVQVQLPLEFAVVFTFCFEFRFFFKFVNFVLMLCLLAFILFEFVVASWFD